MQLCTILISAFSGGRDKQEGEDFLEVTPILTFAMKTEDFRLLKYDVVQSDVSEQLIRWFWMGEYVRKNRNLYNKRCEGLTSNKRWILFRCYHRFHVPGFCNISGNNVSLR
jgi:hypothetical protein